MAKPEKPLLSLGARGTIGDALTYQKRGTGTITRKKPIPTNPRSLAQTYHRWLYEDYAYLWRQQSQAIQQAYRSEGAKRHLTGFSYWMSKMLTDLPDIMAWWTLDDNLGVSASDRSRNNNTALIFGASPVTGVIDQALNFDGINDYLQVANHPSLHHDDYLTIEFWAHLLSTPIAWERIAIYPNNVFSLELDNLRRLNIFIGNGAVWNIGFTSPTNLALNTWYHFSIRCDATIGTARLYINGLFDSQQIVAPFTIGTAIFPLFFAATDVLTQWWNGILDNIILFNRILDDTEILRHSERRYPL